MKLKSLLLAALALAPSFASAHPGHAASALHLHSGTPSALNAFDPTILAVTLLLGSLLLASRLRNQR
jgi:hypothetical protein